MRRTKTQIKDIARGSVIALLRVSLDYSDNDLWVATEGWTQAEKIEFAAEVERIMQRVRP